MAVCLITGAAYDRETGGDKTYTTQTGKQSKAPDMYTVSSPVPGYWSGIWADFTCHSIPEAYERAGGSFPEAVQCYTYLLCRQYGVDYSLVVALIERESGYMSDKAGDGGSSIGYMQIYESAHSDRMKRLDCTDLTNPYQNVKVGIDYLAELLKKYGTPRDAVAAYNYGERGAREHLWDKGIRAYPYNLGILGRAEELREEWKCREG